MEGKEDRRRSVKRMNIGGMWREGREKGWEVELLGGEREGKGEGRMEGSSGVKRK